MASPPRAARVVAPVSAAPLRNDRLEEPDWLSSGEGMTSISFGVFMALHLLFRFQESHPCQCLVGERGRGRLSWLDRVRASSLRWIGSVEIKLRRAALVVGGCGGVRGPGGRLILMGGRGSGIVLPCDCPTHATRLVWVSSTRRLSRRRVTRTTFLLQRPGCRFYVRATRQ